jgi:transposase-like protein
VGLFSSHANELKKAHRHLTTDPACDHPSTTKGRKRKVQPRFSAEKALQVVAAYETGKTVYELANEYDCHRVTISAALKRQGVALRCTSPTTEQIDEMVRLYGSGLSLAKVGGQLGFNASTVHAQLRNAGIQTRDIHGQNR